MATIHKVRPNARTLLAVASGTGRHLEFLQQRYAVEGFDIRESLLTGAKQRCPSNAQWERLDRLVHFDPALAHNGFRINERGFFALVTSQTVD